MKRFFFALVFFGTVAGACQGPEPQALAEGFRSGSRWQVQRFRASTLPVTFGLPAYPLLDALMREQFAWSVVGAGQLVRDNARGQHTTAAFAWRGYTLTLFFPRQLPLRALVRAHGTDTVALRTLEAPLIDLQLTRAGT